MHNHTSTRSCTLSLLVIEALVFLASVANVNINKILFLDDSGFFVFVQSIFLIPVLLIPVVVRTATSSSRPLVRDKSQKRVLLYTKFLI